jgi:hypothetical protein
MCCKTASLQGTAPVQRIEIGKEKERRKKARRN